MAMKEVDESGLLDQQVVMSNVLARASHGLSLPEKRLIVAAIAKIDQHLMHVSSVKDLENRTFVISQRDYQDIAELADGKSAYKEMIRATRELVYRVIKFSRRRLDTGKYERVMINWVEEARYIEGQGTVQITFTTRVMPHLAKLKSHFTRYKLSRVRAIRSMYAWRMIEFMESWSEKGTLQGSITLSLEKLRELMEVPESYRWINIRQRVLLPTMKELKARGIELTYTPKKTGRRITSIVLGWREFAQPDLFQQRER